MVPRPAPLPLASLLLLCACLVSGCASMSKADCLSGNWYSGGYEDGTAGRTDTAYERNVKRCGKLGVAPDQDDWRTGYEAGLSEFCRPESGFALGRNGSDYAGVCPAELEAAFLGSYLDGLEVKLIDLEREYTYADMALESATLRRRSIRDGESTRKADSAVEYARSRVLELINDRSDIRLKMNRWGGELARTPYF